MIKTKKVAILTIFMAAVLTIGSVPAFAKDISFPISRSDSAIAVATNTKDLAGSTWYITNKKDGSNFIENQDVIGFKVKDTNTDVPYSSYHTFSKFVVRYPLSYTTTPAMGANLKLNAQIDSMGQYDYIYYVGEWVS